MAWRNRAFTPTRALASRLAAIGAPLAVGVAGVAGMTADAMLLQGGRGCTYAASGPAVRSRGLVRADLTSCPSREENEHCEARRTNAGSTPKKCAGKPDLKRKG